ncbi:hypothetical protein D3C75_861510 [compost metagenome]
MGIRLDPGKGRVTNLPVGIFQLPLQLFGFFCRKLAGFRLLCVLRDLVTVTGLNGMTNQLIQPLRAKFRLQLADHLVQNLLQLAVPDTALLQLPFHDQIG